MAKDFEVTITDPERAKFFLEVFGRTNVNVTSPVPSLADLPGKPGARIFMLDLKLITVEERERLVAHIAQRFKLPVAEVEASIDTEGVPILDEHCYVVVFNPQKWFD